MDRRIRSMSTFTFGMILVATGVTAALADGTDLDWAPTASVAALSAAVVILVAAIMAPRVDGKRGRTTKPSPEDEASPEAGLSSEDRVGVDEDAPSEIDSDPELEPEPSD